MHAALLLVTAAISAGPANDGAWQEGWTNIAPLNHVSQSFVAASDFIENIDVDVLTGNPKSGESDKLTMDNHGPLR